MSSLCPDYQVQRLTTSGQVKPQSGQLGGFFVATGTPTITLYDNTAGSGAVFLNGLVAVAGTWYSFPARFVKGCYAVISGTCDVSFLFN